MEGKAHLEKVLPFLEGSSADVICLQELYEQDFLEFSKRLKMTSDFAPMTKMKKTTQDNIFSFMGVGFLTKLEIKTDFKKYYYYGDENVPERKMGDNIKTIHRPFLYATVQKDGQDFTIGTTHFTWTPDGQADENQRRDIVEFFKIVDSLPEIIICGDFNAPRGREIFKKIAEKYKDQIPPEYETSLDPELHRVSKGSKLMVDVLFTSVQYETKNVRLECGLSDHCAVIGDIYKG
ncbi:MAG: endonuclease/exonuclease/phosphatase family protein [Patescibacteria group bacterium]